MDPSRDRLVRHRRSSRAIGTWTILGTATRRRRIRKKDSRAARLGERSRDRDERPIRQGGRKKQPERQRALPELGSSCPLHRLFGVASGCSRLGIGFDAQLGEGIASVGRGIGYSLFHAGQLDQRAGDRIAHQEDLLAKSDRLVYRRLIPCDQLLQYGAKELSLSFSPLPLAMDKLCSRATISDSNRCARSGPAARQPRRG